MGALGHALVNAAVAAMVRGNVSAACRLVLAHVLGDRRCRSAVPLPEAARVGIKAARGGFRIEAFGLDFTIADLRLLAGRRAANGEIFHRQWERTVTRARQAHGTTGRHELTGEAKTGGVESTTGFHPESAIGATRKD